MDIRLPGNWRVVTGVPAIIAIFREGNASAMMSHTIKRCSPNFSIDDTALKVGESILDNMLMGSDNCLPCLKDLPTLTEQASELHFSTSDLMHQSSGDWPKNSPETGNKQNGN